MKRFTDKLRKSAGVRDGDPVAPVFDAVDLMAGRVDGAVEAISRTATREARVRRDLVRGIAAVGLVMALASGCLAFAGAMVMIRSSEKRAASQALALEEERTKNFNARVEQRAAAVAFDVVTQANGRAAAAEAQLEIARDKLASLARNADDEVRDLVKSIATAPREDLFLMAKLLRHQNPNVRRACDALTAVSPALITKLQAYFAANKGRL